MILILLKALLDFIPYLAAIQQTITKSYINHIAISIRLYIVIPQPILQLQTNNSHHLSNSTPHLIIRIPMKNSPIKLVVVGDTHHQKTALLTHYARCKYPPDYQPASFDNRILTLQLQDREIKLELWDTSGQEDYDKLRILSYINADVILILFPVQDKHSLEKAVTKWYPEIRRANLTAVVELVGVVSGDQQAKEDDYRLFQLEGDAADFQADRFLYNEWNVSNGKGLVESIEGPVNQVLRRRDSQLTCPASDMEPCCQLI